MRQSSYRFNIILYFSNDFLLPIFSYCATGPRYPILLENLEKRLAAFVAENNNSTLQAYYQKKIKEGIHHYVATSAVARKLAFIIYGVLKEQRPFKDF